MKKLLLISFCLLIFQTVVSQTANTKVQEVYSSAEIAQMSAADVDYLNFLSENMVIVSHADGKVLDAVDFATVIRKDGSANKADDIRWNDFNPLEYAFTVNPDKNTVYSVGQTGLVITVLSGQRLETLYERFKASNKK